VYAVADDVRAVVARAVSSTAGTAAASLGDAVLAAALDSAQAEVDARLAGRYQVPFIPGSVPALVVSLTVDVAAYLATLTFRESTDLSVDDPIRLRYTRAQELLRQLGSGELDLPGVAAGGDTPATSGRATVRNQYAGRMFGLEDAGLGYDHRWCG
jgi:phage gp36-like protein